MKCHMCNTRYTLFEDKWSCFRCPYYLTHEGYIAELEAENDKLREELEDCWRKEIIAEMNNEDEVAKFTKVVEVMRKGHQLGIDESAFCNICNNHAYDEDTHLDNCPALADLESES